MKVFVETEPLLKYPAGIAVYLNRLYGELSALQKEITLYTGFQGADRQVRANWKNAVLQYMPEGTSIVSKLPLPGRLSQWLPCPVKRAVAFKGNDYDLVHFAANGCPPWVQFDHFRNAVLTIHDMFPFHEEIPFPRTRLIRHLLDNLPRQAEQAAAILTVSEFSKKEICRFTGVDPEKIFVTPIATQWQEDIQTIPDSTILDRLQVKPKTYFFTVSALSVHKNYPVLLEAFERYKKSSSAGSDDKLLIAGSRVHGDDELVRKIQMNPHVILLNNLSREDLLTLYRNAGGTFCLSRIEGFGIPLLEAMSCGCPACYASGSSMDEIGRDAAWSVSPDDPGQAAEIMALFRSGDASLESRIMKQKEYAREYSWSKTAQQTYQVFQKTVAQTIR